MNEKYSPLFQPLTIGNMTLKNRIAMAPMGMHDLSDQTIAYYAERAKGGVGMIITGASITTTLFHGPLVNISDAENSVRLPKLVEAVHEGGAKICVMFTPGGGRYMPDSITGEAYSASAIDIFGIPDKTCVPLTVENIKQIIEETKVCARTCKESNADAIMIHAHTGYLFDQFLSSGWNKRDDEYGGNVENRMRFLMEYIDAIREGVGKDFPIIVRFTIDHGVPGIREDGETEEMLKILGSADIQALDVDCGCYEAGYLIFPPYYLGDASELYVTDTVKKLGINLPIINAGNHTPDTGAKAIKEGKADIISFGRSLLADPELANKLLEGRENEIKPCIRCNMGCTTKAVEYGTCCAVNAATGREAEANAVESCEGQKVVVIGGGVAGLEAARTAAERGANVVLMEKDEKLGGVARAIASPEWKYKFRELFDYYEVQMKKLGVKVELNKKVTVDDEELADASKIIVATGATTLTLPINGIDGKNVVSVLEAHKNVADVKGETIVVCGGGLSGCELALELAEEGKKVSIVEMRDTFAPDAAAFAGWLLQIKLATNPNVTLIPNAKVLEFTDEAVVIEENGVRTLPCDMAIHAFGMKSENALGKELIEKYPNKVDVIGDANKVGCIFDAVRKAYDVAMTL